MATPRRDFLGWLGASTAFAAVGMPLPSSSRAPATPRDVPITSDWDMSWVDRLHGKYRAVFDSPQVDEGSALFRAVMWRDQTKTVYGTDPTDMSAVIVFRHAAIPLVMNDAYWARFKIGKELKFKDRKGKWSAANPIRATEAATPAQWADYSLERFMAQGGTVLGCNVAFGEVVYRFRTEDKLSKEDALARAKEHLIPGVILQPSGVFAALRAQEAGCKYIMAS